MADDTSIDDQINAARKQLQAGSGVDTTAPATTTAQPDDSATVAAINAARKSLGVVAGAVAPPDPIPFQTRSFTQDAGDLGSGLLRGFESVVHPVAEGMSYLAGPGGLLDRTTGLHVGRSVADIAAENAAEQAQFEKDHPSGFGTAGTIAGQTVATLPLLGGATGLVAKGGQLLGDAIPAIKSGLTTAGTFLSGGSGGAGSVGSRALQVGSRAAQGSTQGVGASVLTGNTDPASLAAAAATGGVLSSTVPLLAEGASRVMGGTSDMSQQVAQFMANARDKYGINLRATQVADALPTSAKVVRSGTSLIPFTYPDMENAPVMQQWQNAVAKAANVVDGNGIARPLTQSNLTGASNYTTMLMDGLETGLGGKYSANPSLIAYHLAPIAGAVNKLQSADAPGLVNQIKSLVSDASNGASYGSLLNQVDAATKTTASPTALKVLSETREGIRDALQEHLDVLQPQASFGKATPTVMDGEYYHSLRGAQYNQGIIRDAMGGSPTLDPTALSKSLANAAPYNAELPSGLRGRMLTSPSGMIVNNQGLNIPGRELGDLAPIGTSISHPADVADTVAKYARMAEPFAAYAIHGIGMGAPLAHTAALQGGAMAGGFGINRLLGSKWLANRLVNNAGQGVAPWVDATSGPAAQIGANTGNALQH